MRDVLDYHEGALDVIWKRLVKPETLKEDATEAQVKEYERQSEVY